MADPAATTGLVLAGGRGSRMEGRDKGLVHLHGQPLAQWVLQRLKPQVARCAISANRNASAYAALGVPVWADADSALSGPLAGVLAGLLHCDTPWLATVPCDVPSFPADLVARLHAAADAAGVPMALAATSDGNQPVFLLVHRDVAQDLSRFLAEGGRAVHRFAARHAAAAACFADAHAFAGANTPHELAQLALRHPAGAPAPSGP